MARVPDIMLSRQLLSIVDSNRSVVNKLSNQISRGMRVINPSDDPSTAPSISRLSMDLSRIEKYSKRIVTAKNILAVQSDVLTQANDILIRAKELAEQGANETLSVADRASLAEEVLQLRDAMVSLANTKYQGRYIYSGARVDEPAYSALSYTSPSDSSSGYSKRYVYNSGEGTDVDKNVQISDSESVDINTQGSAIFDNAIQVLERLARALNNLDTTLDSNGVPTGGGTTFTSFSDQTTAILNTISDLDTARSADILNEQVTVAAKINRLETAENILSSLSLNAKEAISTKQDVDPIAAASDLSQAQTVLQASLAVTANILRSPRLMDFL